jgi:hypothetical protein
LREILSGSFAVDARRAKVKPVFSSTSKKDSWTAIVLFCRCFQSGCIAKFPQAFTKMAAAVKQFVAPAAQLG